LESAELCSCLAKSTLANASLSLTRDTHAAGEYGKTIMQLPYSHYILVAIGTRERVRDCD